MILHYGMYFLMNVMEVMLCSVFWIANRLILIIVHFAALTSTKLNFQKSRFTILIFSKLECQEHA